MSIKGFGNDKCKEICENICPYCGEKLIMNKRSFANHVRWCKSNPRYNDILKSTKEKISAKNKLEIKEYVLQCEICGKEYTINCNENFYNKKLYRKTCSDKCAKKLTSLKTDYKSVREKQSKTLAKPPIIKICPCCNILFETKNKNKIYCCKECAFKHRYIKDLTLKDLRKYYKTCCLFNFSLNAFPDEFDFSLIEKYGWYKAKNHGDNLNGISRDHMISRNYGFEHLVDPYIISHPANCVLLQHNDNVSKYTKCSLTIEELIQRIKDWHIKYGVYENKINYKFFEENNVNLIKFDI